MRLAPVRVLLGIAVGGRDSPITLDAASAAAAGRPDPGSPLELHLGIGWPVIADASFTPRAVLSLESGIVRPRSRAARRVCSLRRDDVRT